MWIIIVYVVGVLLSCLLFVILRHDKKPAYPATLEIPTDSVSVGRNVRAKYKDNEIVWYSAASDLQYYPLRHVYLDDPVQDMTPHNNSLMVQTTKGAQFTFGCEGLLIKST